LYLILSKEIRGREGSRLGAKSFAEVGEF